MTASDHVEEEASNDRFLREAAETVERPVRRHLRLPGDWPLDCDFCDGTGRVDLDPCRPCTGTGSLSLARERDAEEGPVRVDHRWDGWDGNGDAINPRCPS